MKKTVWITPDEAKALSLTVKPPEKGRTKFRARICNSFKLSSKYTHLAIGYSSLPNEVRFGPKRGSPFFNGSRFRIAYLNSFGILFG